MTDDSRAHGTGKWVGDFFAESAKTSGRDRNDAEAQAQRVARWFADQERMSGRLSDMAREMRESGLGQDGFHVSVTPADELPEVIDARAGVEAAFNEQFGTAPEVES